MNIEFWFTACLLALIALFIIIPPLWKKREIAASDVDQQNIDIARQKSNELKTQLAAGKIQQAQYDVQFTELELALSTDLALSKHTVLPQHQGRWMATVLLICLPLAAILLYQNLGRSDALDVKATNQLAIKQQAEQQMDSINAMVAGLARRLKNEPDDMQGWVMLGKSYLHLKQYPKAAEAFANANVLQGNDASVMLHYADALLMVNQGSFTDIVQQLIFKAIEIEPENKTGLWLAGLIKAEQKQYKQVMAYWLKLESLLQPGSRAADELLQMMLNVASQIPGYSPEALQQQLAQRKVERPQVQDSTSVAITVRVTLAQSLQDKTAATDTVFVYAKAQTGPPMPLAIVHKQVKDLPLQTTLTDAQAMSPMMKLSKFQKVNLTARISKSGGAIPQPGDFIGIVEDVQVTGTEGTEIIIDGVYK